MKHPFEYQRPTPDQTRLIEVVREQFKALHDLIRLVVPPGPEQLQAELRLRESSMWVNAAVVFDEPLAVMDYHSSSVNECAPDPRRR